ncbi:venom serine protease-like [Diabrotica virgifera virgifera]|uniref:Venom serine protease-like n=2 Tax=Diabrotica virgifera virgifera TaxID=50390 RepID=A0ABM5K3C6_DIAVI|nr:venom serine protease-like [Diabrotica virgifera virgifera]
MGVSGTLVVSTLLILYISRMAAAIDSVCDYRQQLTTGASYTFNNYGSPNSYPIGSDCRWWVQGDVDTRVYLTCTIDIPLTSNCGGDKFRVSLIGDGTYFSDARNYCGLQTISLVSTRNTLAVEMYSTIYSSGGVFSCSIKAVRNPVTTTTPAPTCDCGWKQATRIVGGDDTGVHEYPSMAALLDNSILEVICGAVILNQRYVMTAAHCPTIVTMDKMSILVGGWDMSQVDSTKEYEVSNYWKHPQYDANTQINDIAIVQSRYLIAFSLDVGPICLPFIYEQYNFNYQSVTLLGWGQTFYNGPSSDILQKVNVQVTNNSYCQKMMPGNQITQAQICTYASGKDACQHDSGGPVIWQDSVSRRLYAVGVISYGLGCATNRPAVNTRVTSYLDWIVNIIQDYGFCMK